MITLNTTNISQTPLGQGIQTDLKTLISKTATYIQQLKTRNQGWYNLPETAPTKQILNFADSVKGKYQHIVILGIGGSALGINTIFKALKNPYWNELTNEQRNNRPTLHILDNIDPTIINAIENRINLEKTLFICITKSGRTPETISQYHYFAAKYSESDLKKHFVFITDPDNGLLRELSNKLDIKTFSIPTNVGGRFSVLTPVGLLPAALIGIDIESLLKGAAQIRDAYFSNKLNSITELAANQYLLSQKDVNITVLMPYSTPLFTLADWYRQLLAESIGKQVNRAGQQVNTGLTPVNALGVTDQHSQSQLYTEGPKDKLFITIKVGQNNPHEDSQTITTTNQEFAYLNNISFKKLFNVEHDATVQSLTKYKAPNCTLEIPEITATTIGALFMYFELTVAILGEIYGIDAFNQPGVELSKNLTKEALQ